MPAKESPKPVAAKKAAAEKPAAEKKVAEKPAAPKAAAPAAAAPAKAAKPAKKAAKKPTVRKSIGKTLTKAQILQKKKAARPLKLVIDCSNPVSHGIIDISSFEKFLHDKFKVTKKSKAGVLGDQVTITKNNSSIIITLKTPIFKKYLKHLTKRYLKKQQLRDWLRVVSTTKDTYELRYYNIQEAGDESESEDED